MTNIDKVADLLYQRSKELLGVDSNVAHRACQEHAQALADAGLLAPEPDGIPPAGEWEWRVEPMKNAEFASSPWADEKEARDIFQKSKNGLIALGIDPTDHVRLVRRYVSTPEVVE